MLGVPPGERAPFRRYSLAILGALEPVAGPERQAAGNAAVAEFSAYLDELVAERRKRPADDRDVLGTLIHGEVDGERLTPRRVGAELHLPAERRPRDHDQPDRQHDRRPAALSRRAARGSRRNPGLLKSCVEEGLRFESSNQLGNRRLIGRSRDRRRDAAGRHLHPYRHRCGQPRSRAVRRARPLRCRPRAQPPLRLRLGRAHVPGRGAGAHGGHDRDRPAGRPLRRAGARRHARAWRPRPLPRLQPLSRSPGSARAASP